MAEPTIDTRPIVFISKNGDTYDFLTYQILHFKDTPNANSVIMGWAAHPDVAVLEIKLAPTSRALDMFMNYLECNDDDYLPTSATPTHKSHAFKYYLNMMPETEPCTLIDMDSTEVPKNLIPVDSEPFACVTVNKQRFTKGDVITTLRIIDITKTIYVQWLDDRRCLNTLVELAPSTDVYTLHNDQYHLKQRYLDVINKRLTTNNVHISCASNKMYFSGYRFNS